MSLSRLIYIFLSMFGKICFFLETTPFKNIVLFSNFSPNANSATFALFPNTNNSELLFKISVIAKTNNEIPSLEILLFIASSNFSCLFNTSSILTVFTCAITIFSPFFSTVLASKFINSSIY